MGIRDINRIPDCSPQASPTVFQQLQARTAQLEIAAEKLKALELALAQTQEELEKAEERLGFIEGSAIIPRARYNQLREYEGVCRQAGIQIEIGPYNGKNLPDSKPSLQPAPWRISEGH